MNVVALDEDLAQVVAVSFHEVLVRHELLQIIDFFEDLLMSLFAQSLVLAGLDVLVVEVAPDLGLG